MIRSTSLKLALGALTLALLTGSLLAFRTAESASSVAVGSAAPDFTLTDADGKSHTLSGFKGKTVVLEWTNPGCPFVVRHYKGGNMQALQKKYTEQGIVWLSINSTNKSHQDYLDAAGLKKNREEWKVASTAILSDADGKVGSLYNAKTTPHLFIIDKEGKLAYQGAIDDDARGNGAKVNYVEKALDELSAGKAVSTPTTQSYGCSVKYGAKL